MTGSTAERWALVTGAAGDLGRATCEALARDGWSLLLSDHPSQARGLAVASDACAALGAATGSVTFDVTDAPGVEAALAALVDAHGAPTALIANAGIQGDFAALQDLDVDVARRVLEVNVLGVLAVVQIVARLMIGARRGGSIVVTASMAGVNGAPNMAAYAASKAAVIGLAKSASLDLAPHGIRVNAVSPAFIGPGRMWDNQVAGQAAVPSQYYASAPDEVARQMLERIPLRRYGAPSEVADAICFLAGERSSYVTGANLEIAGGAL